MSDQIISRIDDMSSRIDDLEHNINDLMSQAGQGQGGPPMIEKEKWRWLNSIELNNNISNEVCVMSVCV